MPPPPPPTEAPRKQPFFKFKEDGDNDRDRPTAPMIKGEVRLSMEDAALLIDFVLRTKHKEAWFVDVLTHGSHKFRRTQ